jgi:hypothetical protein
MTPQIRRKLRQAERLSDVLRAERHTLSLDIRACPQWQPGTLGRFRARHADVSSRLCLVDCVAALLAQQTDRT